MDGFKGLRITKHDDDDDYEEKTVELMNVDGYDDDDDEEDNKDCEAVKLGFVESPNFSSSNPKPFPSLAGGVPVWLDPINLPSGMSILCDLCKKPLHFVLQLYAPITDKESAIHRTLFLFMCPSMCCLLRDQNERCKPFPEKTMRSTKVFRCQLPRVYSSEAETDKPMGHRVPLCTWCGTWKGDKLCTGCKNARYCSKAHQALHWGMVHNTECQQLCGVALTQKQKVASKSLWKEFVLVYEDENEDKSECEYDTKKSEDDEIAKPLVSKTKEVDDQMNDIEGDADTKCFVTFQQRVAEEAPEQVIRYRQRFDAKPLWPLATGRVTESEIPKCKSCGGPLCFEFQVMPQLLYFFGGENDRESLDWATIVVYTCKNSCESSLSYKEEFVWVQLHTQTT